MRKKLYFLPQLLFLGFLGGLIAGSKGQAQILEKQQNTSARTVKVKIIKEENGKHFLLDTTLTIPAGQSIEEVVKSLKAKGAPMKSLEFKSLPGQLMPAGKEGAVTRYNISFGADSLRAVFFRSFTADSLLAKKEGNKDIWVKTIPAETIKRLSATGESVPAQAITIYRSFKQDSLGKPLRVYKLDSTHLLKGETFTRKETIRVERDGQGSDVKIFRLNKENKEKLLGEGEYEVITLKSNQPDQVLVLRLTKAGSKKAGSKAQSKSKKKTAETIESLEVQFYPNPSNGVVQLSFNAPKKAKAQLRVVDSQGKTLYQEDLGMVQGPYSKQLDLSRYGKGVYVVQVLVGNTAQSGKVVVQ